MVDDEREEAFEFVGSQLREGGEFVVRQIQSDQVGKVRQIWHLVDLSVFEV